MRPRTPSFNPDQGTRPGMEAAVEGVVARSQVGNVDASPGRTSQGSTALGAHSHAMMSPTLSGGTRPPPNTATGVNVWARPPSLATRTVVPVRTRRCDGSRQALSSPAILRRH